MLKLTVLIKCAELVGAYGEQMEWGPIQEILYSLLGRLVMLSCSQGIAKLSQQKLINDGKKWIR